MLANAISNPKPRVLRPTRFEHGSSLIEVLVSIFLVAFGMTAMASMLTYSINANTNAGNRALALMLANEYAELVRANPEEMRRLTPVYVRAADFTEFGTAAGRIAPLLTGLCNYPACNQTTLAERDVAVFGRLVKTTLPGGDFSAALANAGAQMDIWVFWAEARGVIGAGDLEQQSDNCPAAARNAAQDVRPRCIYMRISL